MNLKEYRMLFMSICVSLVLVVTFAFVSSTLSFPVTAEKFFALSILGRERTASDYFLNNDYHIQTLEELQWYVQVENFMQKTQYVVVKVRLLNSTMTIPEPITCTPSPEPELMNFSIFLTHRQSLTVPFYWHVSESTHAFGVSAIEQLVINNSSIRTSTSCLDNSPFRLIFELWYYNQTSEDFRFDWESGFGVRCVWNQMVFLLSES